MSDIILQDATPLKRCPKCPEPEENRWHPATTEFFPQCKSSKDKLNPYCKECINRYNRSRYLRKTPPPEILPDEKKRCTECKEVKPATVDHFYTYPGKNSLRACCIVCANERNKAGYRKNITSRKRYHATYRTANAEKLNRYQKNHYEKNATTIRQRHLRNYYAHIEERRQYRQSHYEQRRAYNRNRQAHKKAAGGTYTAQQIQEQLNRQHYRCYYAACGFAKFKRVNGEYVYEIEHTFPISRVVGTGIPANDISYLVLACHSCNQSKNDKFPWEWPEGGRLL